MRLFLAINLPDDVRADLHEATAPLRAAAPDAAWVAAARLHLTLKFIGEQPPEAATALGEAIGEATARHRDVVLGIGGVGAFPSLGRPRVVWIGVTRDPRLELLHHDVESACAARGFEVDGRAFRPHITLARVRRPLPRDERSGLARAARHVRFHAAVPVASVDLMESRLGAGGSRYTVVATAGLRHT